MTKKRQVGKMKTDAETPKWGAHFCGGNRADLATREQYNRKIVFSPLFFGVDFATYLCPEPRFPFCLCVAS